MIRRLETLLTATSWRKCAATGSTLVAMVVWLTAPAIAADDDEVEPTDVSAADEVVAQDARPSAEDARAASELCHTFAGAVLDHQDDCVAMGTALVAVVDDNWKPLRALARRVGPDPELQAVCLDAVEVAVAPLIACLDDDGVASAMRRLRTLRQEVLDSLRATPPAPEPTAPPQE